MSRIQLFFFNALLLTVVGACWREPEWTDLRRGATDCMVVVFPAAATTATVNGFLEEHTQGPPHPGGGYTQREGIGAVIKRGVDGQTAYEICFWPEADAATVHAIRKEIEASPVIERILEREAAEKAVYGDRL